MKDARRTHRHSPHAPTHPTSSVRPVSVITRGIPHEESSPRIVPNYHSVHQPKPNAVVLMKSNQWPGIRGIGCTHKAPDVLAINGRPVLKRLVLKVDLSERKPGC